MRRFRVAALFPCLAILAASRPATAASLEYRVKAAFLYNFAKFVEWPSHSFPRPETPFTLCLLGADPFGDDLDSLVAGQRVSGRPLVVRRLTDAQQAPSCHVLFLGLSDRDRLSEVLHSLGNATVLTVGDDLEFTRLGGAVRFFLAEDRVRFEINLGAAGKARLKISAKLLALAQVVGKGKG